MSRLTLRCTRQPYHYHNALRVSIVVMRFGLTVVF